MTLEAIQYRSRWSTDGDAILDGGPGAQHLCSEGALLPNSSKETTKHLDFVHVCYYRIVQAGIAVLPQESKAKSHVQLFATSWTVALQALLSVRFSRQEYCSGLPFLSPGDLPDPGIEPRSPTLQVDSLPSEPPGKSVRKREIIYVTMGSFISMLNKYEPNKSELFLWKSNFLNTLREQFESDGKRKKKQRKVSLWFHILFIT